MSTYTLRRDAGGSTDLPEELTSGTPLTNVRPMDESLYEREHIGQKMFTAEPEDVRLRGRFGTIHLFEDEIEEEA